MAAGIFGPIIEPETSTSRTTSRGTAPVRGMSAGGTRVATNRTPASVSAVQSTPSARSPAKRKRRMKSRLGSSSLRARPTVSRPSARPSAVACWEQTRSVTCSPPGSSSTSMLRSWAGRTPGSSRGGLMREASGTSSVSGAAPSPEGSPSRAAPGM